MPVEGQVKFYRSQNTAGVSQEKQFKTIPQTNVVHGGQFSNVKK